MLPHIWGAQVSHAGWRGCALPGPQKGNSEKGLSNLGSDLLSSPTSSGLKAGENNLPRENMSMCQVGSWEMGSPPWGGVGSQLGVSAEMGPGNHWYIPFDGQAALGSVRPRSAEPESHNERPACKWRELRGTAQLVLLLPLP